MVIQGLGGLPMDGKGDAAWDEARRHGRAHWLREHWPPLGFGRLLHGTGTGSGSASLWAWAWQLGLWQLGTGTGLGEGLVWRRLVRLRHIDVCQQCGSHLERLLGEIVRRVRGRDWRDNRAQHDGAAAVGAGEDVLHAWGLALSLRRNLIPIIHLLLVLILS